MITVGDIVTCGALLLVFAPGHPSLAAGTFSVATYNLENYLDEPAGGFIEIVFQIIGGDGKRAGGERRVAGRKNQQQGAASDDVSDRYHASTYQAWTRRSQMTDGNPHAILW